MSSTWRLYSSKLKKVICNPRSAGFFSREDAEGRKMHYAVGREGFVVDGNAVALYWLVDPADGIIVDAKFQVFGQSALIGAADTLCELLIGKNYDQARRITAELIDKKLRDKGEKAAFPRETVAHLNLVISAVDDASEQCLDIPLSEHYVTPISADQEGEGYPGWVDLSEEKKIAVIEKVLDEEIRPYVELDAGGIELQGLKGFELTIGYQGACTSCFSAIGTTLSTIQQILRAKVYSELVVVPNMEQLTF